VINNILFSVFKLSLLLYISLLLLLLLFLLRGNIELQRRYVTYNIVGLIHVFAIFRIHCQASHYPFFLSGLRTLIEFRETWMGISGQGVEGGLEHT